MAQYTITLDAGSDAYVEILKDQYNAENGTAITRQEYIQLRAGAILADAVRVLKAEEVAKVSASFENADQTVKDLVKGQLGV